MSGRKRFISVVVLRHIIVVVCTIFVVYQMALAEIGNQDPAGIGTKGVAFGKKVKGNLGERMMDDFYTSSGYTKIDCSVGVNGADGVYVTYNSEGTVDNVIFSECKTDTAQLGRIDGGEGAYQGSREYYIRKVDEKIAALERGPKTPETAKQIKALKQIRRKAEVGDCRSRLFRMSHEVRDGKTYVKMQSYELDFKNGPKARPTAIAKGRPSMIDMTSPDVELSPYYRARRNNYLDNLVDELVDRTKKGGYGVKKPLTEKEARAIVAETKNAYQTGSISSKDDLIKWLAKKCGIGDGTAKEIVEKGFVEGTSSKSVAIVADEEVDDLARKMKVGRMFKTSPIAQAYERNVVKASENIANRLNTALEKTLTRDQRLAKSLAAKGCAEIKTTVGIMQTIQLQDGSVVKVLHVPVENVAKGVNAGLMAGVMTFIISEGVTGYCYFKGDITKDKFVLESAKNLTASILIGTATFVAVALGASPWGPVVLAIGIGTYLLCDIAFSRLERAIEYRRFHIEDMLGEFPIEFQRRRSTLEYDGYDSLLEYYGDGDRSLLETRGEDSLLDYNGEEESLLTSMPEEESLLEQ